MFLVIIDQLHNPIKMYLIDNKVPLVIEITMLTVLSIIEGSPMRKLFFIVIIIVSVTFQARAAMKTGPSANQSEDQQTSPQNLFSAQRALPNFITGTSMYLFSLFEPDQLLQALKNRCIKENPDEKPNEYRLKRFINLLNIENFQMYFIPRFFKNDIDTQLGNIIKNPTEILTMLNTLQTFLNKQKQCIEPVLKKLMSIKSKDVIGKLEEERNALQTKLGTMQKNKNTKEVAQLNDAIETITNKLNQELQKVAAIVDPALNQLRTSLDTSSILAPTISLLHLLYSADVAAIKNSQELDIDTKH
jgi:hypothetical protein